MSQKFNVAVLGATGLVGRQIIETLEDRKFPVDQLFLLASSRSAGEEIQFRGESLEVIDVEEFDFSQAHIGLFSAGGSVSEKYAPIAADAGCVVIDNTSHFRNDYDVPLIIPEVNASSLADFRNRNIIANPNCSTIQLVMALSPLHKMYNILRLVVSTYQSVSGSGIKAVNQLMNERKGLEGEKSYPHQIDLNVLPHAGDFVEDGYTSEEIKLVEETNKILNADIRTTATVVRVPVIAGHSESVNIEFENDFVIEEIKRLLGNMPGIVLFDFPEANLYPMPIIAAGKDEVFVGRIRRDFSQPNTLNLWVVSDNLRKAAATNAVQIVQYLISNSLI